MDLQHSNLEYIYLEPHLDIHVLFKVMLYSYLPLHECGTSMHEM